MEKEPKGNFFASKNQLRAEGELGGSPKKRSFDSMALIYPASPAANERGDLKKRKESLEPEKRTEAEPSNINKTLSAKEAEEMTRKVQHWWNLPAPTTQEEYDQALVNFKEGRYFQLHLDVARIDVQIQRACGRRLSQDQFSAAAQDLCTALHRALTHNDTERLKTLAQGDGELLQLCEVFKETSSLMQQERQKLTDKFGIIHSAKIAIKSEVYISAATRLIQAEKEVTDEAVAEELTALERGAITFPDSELQGGGDIVAARPRGEPPPPTQAVCSVLHDSEPINPAQRAEYTGHKVPTCGEEGIHRHEEEVGGTAVHPVASQEPSAFTEEHVYSFTGLKAPTCGDEGLLPGEKDEDE